MASRAFARLAVVTVLPCADAADTNDDGGTDISDGIRILNDFFIEGTAIPAPGPFTCGPDPTPDELSCPAASCG